MMKSKPTWNEYTFKFAYEVFDHAKRGASLHEYKKFVSLQPTSIYQNQYDRNLVLNSLLSKQVIGKNPDGTLYISSHANQDWLTPHLEKGEKKAWDICNNFFPHYTKIIKFDDSKNKQIGEDGEEFVVAELKRTFNDEKSKQVNHVAKKNDILGYDVVSPVLYSNTKKVFLEIKTNSNPYGKFRCYLSRNEFKKSQKFSNWYLVLVRLINGLHILEGHIPGKHLSNIMPIDNEKGISRWESASIIIDKSMITEDLPIYF